MYQNKPVVKIPFGFSQACSHVRGNVLNVLCNTDLKTDMNPPTHTHTLTHTHTDRCVKDMHCAAVIYEALNISKCCLLLFFSFMSLTQMHVHTW